MLNYFIRPVERADARGIHQLRRMEGVFENVMTVPSERPDRSENIIAGLDENTHMLAAVLRDGQTEGQIIGTISLNVSTKPRTRHVGTIGIMVHRDYQGMGVGTRLMQAALDIADNWLMLVRVELNVFCDNAKAIALYEKASFVREGTKRFAAIRNGRYCDEYIMARIRPYCACGAERAEG